MLASIFFLSVKNLKNTCMAESQTLCLSQILVLCLIAGAGTDGKAFLREVKTGLVVNGKLIVRLSDSHMRPFLQMGSVKGRKEKGTSLNFHQADWSGEGNSDLKWSSHHTLTPPTHTPHSPPTATSATVLSLKPDKET